MNKPPILRAETGLAGARPSMKHRQTFLKFNQQRQRCKAYRKSLKPSQQIISTTTTLPRYSNRWICPTSTIIWLMITMRTLTPMTRWQSTLKSWNKYRPSLPRRTIPMATVMFRMECRPLQTLHICSTISQFQPPSVGASFHSGSESADDAAR